MENGRRHSKIKPILKGIGITLVFLLGLFGFAFIEVIMTGCNLDNPGDMCWWLGLITLDFACVVGALRLLLRW